MTRIRWVRVCVLLAAVALVAYLLVPSRAAQLRSPSFLPEIDRLVGIRFDPSFFYDRGLTASELAAREVDRWHRAGVNAIFFRAYDPTYGASYRTALPHNVETDYGRQDLLGCVLEEAHRRGMKVYAWLTAINHRGIWEAKETWRAVRPNGEAYRTDSLPYPLCPREPGVVQWWTRFLDDLLERYPALDGVDLAEPVVSWREGEACHCALCRTGFENGGKESAGSWGEYRALALGDLVLETFRRARARGMATMLTSVLPAGADGKILPFSVLRDRTGLDLDRILGSPDRPDLLSLELMWQEWAEVFKASEVFRPAWIGRAIEEAHGLVAGRARLIAHLEISDFGALAVTRNDLAASLRAALEAGAAGVEVYDAALLDKKDAWGALDDLATVRPGKRVLILFDEVGESDAWQVATLCGHFGVSLDVRKVTSYAKGEIAPYDAVFYLGIEDRAPIPDAFVDDVAAADTTIVWINFNIQRLLNKTPRYGFVDGGSRNDPSFNAVRYRGALLVRQEPHMHLVQIVDPAKVQVVAELVSPDASVPSILRSGRFWYCVDNPLSFAVEGGSYVVLADLLHEILGEDHVAKKLALVRLEDVHPLTPPDSMRAAARILSDRGIPFLVALVPYYVFPEMGEFVSMGDQPEFVDALKYMIARGATVVLHGVTHQRTRESTADYEFWDALANGPNADRTDAKTRARLARGLEECLRNGIHPLLWETPHYASSLADYRVFAEVFSAAVERRQSADRIGTDQLYPYAIVRDRFGQLLLPENLGYVPLAAQDATPILEAARRTAIVRDATVGFFFHLFCDLGVLERIADGLLEQGFAFPNVATLGLTVKGPDFTISTTRAPFPAQPPSFAAALFDEKGKEVWRGEPAAFPRDREPPIGTRLFLGRDLGGDGGEAARLRMSGDEGFLVKPLSVAIAAPPEEYEDIALAFRSIAAPTARLDLGGEVASIPADATLVVVSERIAAALDPMVGSQLMKFAGEGGALLTWGKTALAEEAGVEFTEEERDIIELADRSFPGSPVRLPQPRRAAVPRFDGEAEILCEANEEKIPILAALSVDEGTFIYSAIPPFAPEAAAPYPYLMSALQSQCLLAPICRAKRFEIYFDPGLREDVSVEELVDRWARHGVRVIHAGAWHEYAEWTYEYDRLIRVAHQKGMLVNAWLVLPLVSEKFWNDHPEWREKNWKGEDVAMGWRKIVSLIDPACREAVKRWLRDLVARYDFDGVNLAGLCFGGEKVDTPETFSPFSDAARADFAAKHGHDPRELFDPNAAAAGARDLKQFFAWRAAWTTRLHRELLDHLGRCAPERPLAITVTVLDAAARPAEAELAGVDTAAILDLRKEFPFRVQLMDPADARPRGAARLASMVRDYGDRLDPSALALHIDLGNEIPSLPARRMTGAPLYALIAAAAPIPVAIYSEDALPDADWPLLANASAAFASCAVSPEGIAVRSSLGVRLALAPDADIRPLVDGVPWLSSGRGELLVPPGEHRVTFSPGSRSSETTIVESSCDIAEVAPVARGIRFSYESRDRACVVLSGEAIAVSVDGVPFKGTLPAAEEGVQPLMLPPGKHVVVALTESWSAQALRVGSMILSGGIVALSGISLFLVAVLFIWGRLSARRKRQRLLEAAEGRA